MVHASKDLKKSDGSPPHVIENKTITPGGSMPATLGYSVVVSCVCHLGLVCWFHLGLWCGATLDSVLVPCVCHLGL